MTYNGPRSLKAAFGFSPGIRGSRLVLASSMIVLAGCSLDALRLAGEVTTHWDEKLRERRGYALFDKANTLVSSAARASCSSASNRTSISSAASQSAIGSGRDDLSQMTIAADPQRLISGKDMVDLMHQFDARILRGQYGRRKGRPCGLRSRYFDVAMIDKDGVLLTLRDRPKVDPQ